MYIKKNTIIISLFVLAIVFFSLCFYLGILTSSNHHLDPFTILEFNESDGIVNYNIENNFYADKYEIILIDEDGNVLHDKTYEKPKGSIKDLSLPYLTKLTAKVTAIHDDEIYLDSTNTFNFTWNSPSFSNKNTTYIQKGNDFNIYVDGDFITNNYRLQLKYDGKVIRETELEDAMVTFPYDLVGNYSGRISAYIIDEAGTKISNYNFYVNTILVGSISITSPTTDYVSWEDFIFSYDGGDNADAISLKIFKINGKKKTLSRIIGITEKETKVNINFFEEDTTYTLELTASYKDYEEIARTAEITFKTGKRSEVKKVYTTVDYHSLKPGTKFTLETLTEGAKIMYSTDGSDPVTYGKMYTEPINITEDTKLKAVAIKSNMSNSLESTFDIKVLDKVPVVYLSPSNQKSNPGVHSVGYSNERVMMNKGADVVERVLKNAGVKVYRNNPEDNMRIWLNTSRSLPSDLHFAIHSNGSVGHNVEGMEIYVHDEDSAAYSVAQTIYNDLFEVYKRDGHTVGRGVLFARGRMGEVHPLNVKMGVLIEIAYHDYKDDAKWIVDNINEIGETMANSILKYFQMI